MSPWGRWYPGALAEPKYNYQREFAYVRAIYLPASECVPREGIKLTLSLMQLFTVYFCCHNKGVATQIKMANERSQTTAPKYAMQLLFQPGNPGEL